MKSARHFYLCQASSRRRRRRFFLRDCTDVPATPRPDSWDTKPQSSEIDRELALGAIGFITTPSDPLTLETTVLTLLKA
jgi:hypothetical protein